MKRIFLLLLLVIFVPTFAIAQEDADLEDQLERLQELESELESISGELDGLEPQIPEFDVSSEELRATVTEILSDEEIDGQRQMVFVAEVDGERFTVDTTTSLLDGLRYDVRVGTDVYLQVIYLDGEVTQIFLVDVVRTGALIWIVLLFAAMIIAIGLWRGVASLAGLVVTLGLLFGWMIPQMLAGADPVLITVIGSIIILAVNMHLSHGFNKGTALAFGSTTIGLALVWIFANLFVWFANLSGLASEEAILLQYNSETIAAPAGILLAGIILGAVGVLDDVAITQSETVAELRRADPKMDRKKLFAAAMRLGRHHIASTVNTLVLAYAGVALPLLLLFMHTQGIDGARFLNEEPVAEEIIRTIAGTLALILTVPISTWLATYANKR